MAIIVQRLVKGSPLTLKEHDDNFVNLNTELATKATPASVDVQIAASAASDAAALSSAIALEVSSRDAAITAGDTSTLNTAKAYTNSNIATEVTNRNSAITTAITTLKGGVPAEGDTLGKLHGLITGSNSGVNTGDETAATIKTKLGITAISGTNTGDQTDIIGNANTATKLQTVRTINGVDFDGSASININAVDATSRVASSLLGVANGVATLDDNGLVPALQLPSYVDDVLEAATFALLPATGITGKIYVTLDTNKTYRWSGTAYVYITSGAVDSVAGKNGIVTLVKSDVGLSNVDNTSDANKPVSTAQATADANVESNAASDATTKANAAQAAAIAASAPVAHVGAGGTSHAAVTTTVNGFMIAADKSKLDGIASGATANVGTVTAVTATAPIVSSGGTAPVLSISAATTVAAGSMSATDKVKLNAITGTNTGDETTATIQSKLGITTLSGTNTGDETTATIKSKLGITTLTGSNTGDQVNVSGSSGSCTGNSVTATTATYLSSTQQINNVIGRQSSMAMIGTDSSLGSFVCKATGSGDANLAGVTFWNDAYAIKLGVRSDGAFGLGGWSRAAWSWYSDAAGNMIAAGNVSAYSDPRLKENIVPIGNAMDIINQLNGVRFSWKHGYAHTEVKAGKQDIGILANEVEAVLPEIVTESIEIEGEKYKTVAYDKLVPVLIEAMKDMFAKVQTLEAEIALLKNK